MSDAHPIKILCQTLAVSRSGYYQWRRSGQSARARQQSVLTAKIAQVYEASRQTYGSPRVTACLRAQGERVGRHRVARLMRHSGLQGRQRRRYRVRTTDSDHDQPIAPNLLAKASAPTRPD